MANEEPDLWANYCKEARLAATVLDGLLGALDTGLPASIEFWTQHARDAVKATKAANDAWLAGMKIGVTNDG